MSYTTEDFSESLKRVGIDATGIDSVIAAWGRGEGQGEDSGRGWSEDGVTEWAGGFLFKLKDGRYAYVSGWCDYTGWGCQDGAEAVFFDALPQLVVLDTETRDWDEAPIDLNRWLATGAEDPLS